MSRIAGLMLVAVLMALVAGLLGSGRGEALVCPAVWSVLGEENRLLAN